MNIMTVESKHLFLHVQNIKEHLEMANSLYEILNKNIAQYQDLDLFKNQLNQLKDIIKEEKQEFIRAIELTKRYLAYQNTKNMKLVEDLCKQTEEQMHQHAMKNPILSFF